MGIVQRFSQSKEDWGLSKGIIPDFSRPSVVTKFLNWAMMQPEAEELIENNYVVKWDEDLATTVWEYLLSSYSGV